MADFNFLLAQLHGDNVPSAPIAVEQDEYIIINKDRTFTLPEGFSKIIAYEGDVNSQIVSFICPATSEGHDLAQCGEKRLRWRNSASGNEGSSKLKMEPNDDSTMVLRWEIPSEAFTKAGDLSFSISIFDVVNGKIAFSWNTPSYAGLSVGRTLESVGYNIAEGGNEYIPPRDEVLIINTDTRAIVAPTDYNSTFCNYGDVDSSIVYFRVNRYIRGIDLLDEKTIFKVYWKIKDFTNVDSSEYFQDTKRLYTIEISDRDSEGQVNLIWRPTDRLTQNSLNYQGAITILIEFQSGDGKIWRTAPFGSLKIGKNDFSNFVDNLPEEGNQNGYVIDGTISFEDKVPYTVAGISKLRPFTSNQPILCNENELIVERDDADYSYIGIKIGTKNNQSSWDAPYIAFSPNTTVIVHGGDASGN